MKKLLIGGLLLVMALAIPVTLTLVSQQQDTRQRAAEITQATCDSYTQRYFDNLSNQPSSGTQYYDQFQSQFRNNCPTSFPMPSRPPVPSVTIQPTGSGTGGSSGGTGGFSSFLCSYYQNYLTKLQSSGTCTSNPTTCNQITTQLKNLNCQGANTSPTASISPTKSPTGGAIPTLPPVNPPIYNALADLNDDGKIDELDLNILYAGFAKRKGD